MLAWKTLAVERARRANGVKNMEEGKRERCWLWTPRSFQNQRILNCEILALSLCSLTSTSISVVPSLYPRKNLIDCSNLSPIWASFIGFWIYFNLPSDRTAWSHVDSEVDRGIVAMAVWVRLFVYLNRNIFFSCRYLSIWSISGRINRSFITATLWSISGRNSIYVCVFRLSPIA